MSIKTGEHIDRRRMWYSISSFRVIPLRRFVVGVRGYRTIYTCYYRYALAMGTGMMCNDFWVTGRVGMETMGGGEGLIPLFSLYTGHSITVENTIDYRFLFLN